MGCDIHLYTEKKIKIKDEEHWVCCDRFRINEFKPFYDDEELDYIIDSIYDSRDYELFTALADVRHCNGVDVIDDPRGLPDDVSEIIKKESDYWDCDGHSRSWLTARELFIYKNTHPYTIHSGLIDKESAKKLDNDGILPKYWCQWTNSTDYEWREWKEPGSVVDYLVECVKKRMAEEFGIRSFLSDEEKEKIYWDNADNFRIVFWFDN